MRRGLVLAVLGATLLLGACAPRREPFITYYSGRFELSLRYPASWKTEQTEQDGTWYRYFLAPPPPGSSQPAVSVTLLAAAREAGIEALAATYLAGHQVLGTTPAARAEASGRSWRLASPDGARRASLLVLDDGRHLVGLYAQGEATQFEAQRAALDEMAESLTIERPASWRERRNPRYAFSLRVPVSWQHARSLGSGGRYMEQFTSPPLAAERQETVHASLMLTVEPLAEGMGIAEFYEESRRRLGDAVPVLRHEAWKDGYADLLKTETPVSEARSKRFYRVANGRGYAVAFEAREDVFHRVSAWADQIADTLAVGEEVSR
jgi:hypothetical protein